VRNIKISEDSREIAEEGIFVAIKGSSVNGEDYISKAIENGASEVVVDSKSSINIKDGIKLTKVDNPRRYLSQKSAELYPKQPKYLTAVTGTSGKTSVAFFFKELCKHIGFKSSSIGTLGVLCDNVDISFAETLTSPSAPHLHKALEELSNAGVNHVCVEASSHGLDQYRVASLKLKAAAFTNFSRDHLDYHEDMDDYFKAKMRLFNEVLGDGIAVLNADIPQYQDLIKNCKNYISYGEHGKEIKLLSYDESSIAVTIKGEQFNVETDFAATFQKYNLLAAAGLVLAIGIEPKEITQAMEKVKIVPGRMHFAGEKNGAKIYVDYAHKPEALETVLKSLKTNCLGSLKLVFGCGGDRDKGKRSIMGSIAQTYADEVFITDDNPRTEDASSIRKEILESCSKAVEIAARGEAIRESMSNLHENDILVIAGKGHEEYQIFGDKKSHFSDFEEVQKNLTD